MASLLKPCSWRSLQAALRLPLETPVKKPFEYQAPFIFLFRYLGLAKLCMLLENLIL